MAVGDAERDGRIRIMQGAPFYDLVAILGLRRRSRPHLRLLFL